MKKTRKKLSTFFLAFLVLAFVFLALGLGTLGTVKSTGNVYELLAVENSSDVSPNVVFKLSNPLDKDTATVYTRLKNIYLNIAVLYTEEGEEVEIRIDRGSSSSSFPTSTSYNYKATIANFGYSPSDEEESTAITDGFFHWIAPFEDKLSGGYRVASYSYYRLSASANILINEVVFVGEILESSAGEGTGKYCVIPTEIFAATPMETEVNETAIKRASALVDAQYMPNTAESTFSRYSNEEIAVLQTLAEMRTGGSYSENDVYYGDTIYNSLGIGFLSLGTAIFGMSPFGLRFFPMLASFGVLMIGYFLVKEMFKSEKAGFAFALIYALCNFSIGFGHLGTPLMIGVFFFAAAFFTCYLFYSRGMKNAGFKGAYPLALSGIFGAAAICVNGAFLIPVAAIVGLFAVGLVRQQKARRYYLDLAIAEAEAEDAEIEKLRGAEADKAKTEATGRVKVAKVLSEYRNKNVVACASFFTTLVIGSLLFSLLFLIPVYFVAVKLFDNVVSPSLNIFSLAAKYFAGGFVGANVGGSLSAWNVIYTLFSGSGEVYAVTAIIVNVAALFAALFGIGLAIARIVMICKKRDWSKKSELRSVIVLLAAFVVCMITASFAKGAIAFLLLAYVFAFMLAGNSVRYFTEKEGEYGKWAKAYSIVGIVVLALCFLLTAIFTFSLPLPASFMNLFG